MLRQGLRAILLFSFAWVSVACGGPYLTRTTDIRDPLVFHEGDKFAVQHFSLEGASLPEKTDDWYKDWKLDLVKSLAEAVATRLNEAGMQTSVYPADQKVEAQYYVRGRYLNVEPGQKKTRGIALAFGGYAGDAGKAYIVIEGDIVDRDGKQVMTFYHKEVPPQSFVTDATGAFADAIAATAEKLANSIKKKLE